jgi:SAM-dependent methyltransferase
MTDQKTEDKTDGWEAYWQGAKESDAFVADGFSHPAFAAIWSRALSEFLVASGDQSVRFLDIGAGSGAVVEAICKQPATDPGSISCVDISASAIAGIQKRFLGVNGVVADAVNIPLESGTFDLITSQFGIEYAGPEALDEAARLLTPNGSLLFLLHNTAGALYAECGTAIDALRRVEACKFIDLTREFLETGFAAVRGADRGPYEAAASAMNPAIQELEAILSEHGEHVAGDTVVKLLMEVQNFHARIQHYDPDEVMGWLENMQIEIPKQLGRMESMQRAALDQKAFEAVCERLSQHGLSTVRAQPAQVRGEALPVAWILQASR